MISYLFILLILAVLVTSFIVTRIRVGAERGLLTKIIASLGLISAAMFAIFYYGFSNTGGLIVFGLVFGLVGDILLDLKVMNSDKDKYYLNAGIISFSMGHFLYLVAIIKYVSQSQYTTPALWIIALISLATATILSAIIIFVISPAMKLKFGKFLYQSFAYCVLLIFMTCFSIGISIYVPTMWFVGAGMFLFLVSDLLLSMQYFGDKTKNGFLIATNHAAYYAAQILILSLLFF